MILVYIGIDIGGTSIKSGVVNHQGEVITKHAVTTPKNDNEAFLEALYESVTKVMAEAKITASDIKAIGIGNPGVVDRERGILLEAHNIGFENVPARQYLREHIADVPVLVENDANCAALGEFYRAQNSKNFVFVTLGTGIGGGIIINGKLFTGANGAAGELGHIVTHIDGRQCSCGRKGCWEAYASVTGLIKTTKENLGEVKGISPDEEITGRTVFDLARRGDAGAKRIRDMWIEEISVGIVNIANIFQPDELVIGGAISKEGSVLLDPIADYVQKNAYSSDRIGSPRIVISRVGGDAGIIGAALLYKNQIE